MKKIQTIMRKEWVEVFRNKMVLFTVIFLPLIMTALPLGIMYGMGGSELSGATSGLPASMTASCPAGLGEGDCFKVYMVSQFMMLFMILPVAIPATISAYSIVGEKTTHSLEPLLATPITTTELLLGKSFASLVPAVLATFAAFGIFVLGSAIIVRNATMLSAFLDLRWILAIFIVGPLMAILSIVVSLMVSSRVNDPRAAEQISMVVILPVLMLFFGQMANLIQFNQLMVVILAVVLIVIDSGLVYLAVQTFQRETILTRWK